MEADFLSLPEVAVRAGVSVDTIRRDIRAGKLPAVRVRQALMVSPEDLDEYLKPQPVARPRPARNHKRRRSAKG